MKWGNCTIIIKLLAGKSICFHLAVCCKAIGNLLPPLNLFLDCFKFRFFGCSMNYDYTANNMKLVAFAISLLLVDSSIVGSLFLLGCQIHVSRQQQQQQSVNEGPCSRKS